MPPKKKPAANTKSPKPPQNSGKRERRFWLFKSEPDCFSIDDLAKQPKQTTFWDGVRNYQARNFLRDDIQVGDGVLYYHSSTEPMAVVGRAEVVKAGYPDHTAFDPKADHYDAKSDPDNPTWYLVDIKLVEKFAEPLTRPMLPNLPALKDMVLLQRGSRLSVQPVKPAEWEAVLKLAGT